MIEKGLVCRRGSEDKTYKARLQLTEDGKRAADFVAGRARAAVEVAGRELSDENRVVFYAALSSIAKNLEELCRDGIPD